MIRPISGMFSPGQAGGIALAVVTLVVMQHAGDDVLDLLDVAQDARADLRVLFHLLEFFGRELAGLLQHGFGHADLADVVQQAGHVDALDLVIGQLDLGRQMPAEQRDALAVAAGVRILGVDRAGEAVQQAHHQAVHVFEQHRVFEIDRRFVGDRVQQLAVDRVELAGGAQRRDVLRLVLWQGGKLVLIGLLAGLFSTLVAAHLLTSMLFETSPYDPITLATITILLGIFAVLACLLPAYRAATTNPIEALRAE